MHKNTIRCPGCNNTLRVATRVISDGNEYWFYLCPTCEDVAAPDASGAWQLRGIRSPAIEDMVSTLREFAIESWRERSTTRAPITKSPVS